MIVEWLRHTCMYACGLWPLSTLQWIRKNRPSERKSFKVKYTQLSVLLLSPSPFAMPPPFGGNSECIWVNQRFVRFSLMTFVATSWKHSSNWSIRIVHHIAIRAKCTVVYEWHRTLLCVHCLPFGDIYVILSLGLSFRQHVKCLLVCGLRTHRLSAKLISPKAIAECKFNTIVFAFVERQNSGTRTPITTWNWNPLTIKVQYRRALSLRLWIKWI